MAKSEWSAIEANAIVSTRSTEQVWYILNELADEFDFEAGEDPSPEQVRAIAMDAKRIGVFIGIAVEAATIAMKATKKIEQSVSTMEINQKPDSPCNAVE